MPSNARQYRVRDRWRDARGGRTDGRGHIPPVTQERAQTAGYLTESAEDEAPEDSVGETQPAPRDAQKAVAVTPYLDGLRSARDMELASEFGQHQAARLKLHKDLTDARARRDPFATDMEYAATQLAKVSADLTEEELNRRGPAERDESKWPASMLHERRNRMRRAVRLEAEEELRQATIKLRVAALAVEHAQLAYDDHLRVTQAEGWQIVHHYGRREATYLRSLARRHKSGPALVELLRLSDRELPDWLLRAEDDKEDS